MKRESSGGSKIPAAARLALIACAALGLASCGNSGPVHPTAASRTQGPLPHNPAGCPLGRPLPAGTRAAIDYVDFVQLGGRFYLASGHITPGRLGPVVTRIRCSLTAEEDQGRGAPPVVDRTAAFLAVGARVHRVHGYAPGCRVAAYGPDGLTVYLAQVQHGQSAPVTPRPCATAPPH